MKPIKIFLFFYILCGAVAGFSQGTTVVEGRVTDKNTNEALDYASVRFKGSFSGVKTDTAGYFKLTTTSKVKSLVVTYLGYQNVELPVQQGVSNHIDVKMNSQNINLKELVVKPGKRKRKEIDTTAMYIFRHVVANKDYNKASTIGSYHYNEYTKMVYSYENPSQKVINAKVFKPYKFFFNRVDTTEKGRSYIPLFLEEDYKETYYRKDPKKKISVIHYRKMSGVKGPMIVKLIGYQFEVTDAYENVHIVFQKSFISPFSPGANLLYNYHVLDTSKIEGRTTYRLNFVGRNKEDLCVKGFADIDSATWAIKFISYRPNEKANMNIIFDLLEEQNFDLFNNHWLMTKEKLTLEGNLLKDPKREAVRIVKTTLRNNITTNIALPDSVMKRSDDIVDRNAYKRKIGYIDSLRMEPLSDAEKRVYFNFDTVKKVPSYEALRIFTTFITTANIKGGPLDFGRLYNCISVNNVEGYRVRMGVRTNADLDDHMYLGAYGAYGTRDKMWKYSFNARYLLPAKYDRWHAIELEYKSDMLVLGDENPVVSYDNITTLLTGNTFSKVMRTKQVNLYYERDWIKGLSSNITLSSKTFYSVPGFFTFTQPDGHGNYVYLPSINTSEISADLRYCKTDYYFQSYTYRTPLQTKTPAITFMYTMGVKNQLFNGDYTYVKLGLKYVHRVQWPAIGYSKITLRTGYTFGDAPYPVSYIASSNTSILRDDFSFQSTAPFEFVSDKFIMAWWEHYFDGFFFNRIPYVNRLHLREYVQIKALYGGYSQHNADLIPLPAGMSAPSPMPYVEVGCGVENIADLFHIDFLWRVTYRNNPSAPNFTVKFMVYPGF